MNMNGTEIVAILSRCLAAVDSLENVGGESVSRLRADLSMLADYFEDNDPLASIPAEIESRLDITDLGLTRLEGAYESLGECVAMINKRCLPNLFSLRDRLDLSQSECVELVNKRCLPSVFGVRNFMDVILFGLKLTIEAERQTRPGGTPWDGSGENPRTRDGGEDA